MVGYDGEMDGNSYESPQRRNEAPRKAETPILSRKGIFCSFGLVAMAGVCATRDCDCVAIIVLERGEGAFRSPFLGFLAFDIVMGAVFLIAAIAILRAVQIFRLRRFSLIGFLCSPGFYAWGRGPKTDRV